MFWCKQDLNAQMKESCNTGTITEAEMQRMLSGNSKMFPNGIPECGVDALRMTLCSHNIKSQYTLVYATCYLSFITIIFN